MKLFPKNSLGRKYTHLISSSPFVFILFLSLGILLFLSLTLSIKIEGIKTYPVELIKTETNGIYVLSLKLTSDSFEDAFLYTNRNESVHPVTIWKVESSGAQSILYVREKSKEMLALHPSEKLYLDVPQDAHTLLYWIIVKGGKGNV